MLREPDFIFPLPVTVGLFDACKHDSEILVLRKCLHDFISPAVITVMMAVFSTESCETTGGGPWFLLDMDPATSLPGRKYTF